MIAIFGRETGLAHSLRVSPWPGYHSFHPRWSEAMPPKAPTPAAPASLDAQTFARNMLTVGMKSQKLLMDFTTRAASRESPVALDPLNISGAMLSLAKAMSGDREAVAEAQTQWWNNFMTLWESTARKMLGGEAAAV